jgi:glyoxalase family protein
MKKSISGIHHITAICGDPQPNVDFYAGVLGLRLVKRTVNFDDPGTYHLYYGDGAGHPGTILTFFPWPSAGKGRRGNGQVTVISFAVPEGSIPFWEGRLRTAHIDFERPADRHGEPLIACNDPDGMAVELIATSAIESDRAYEAGPIPKEYAIHGFHSATLSEEGYGKTAELLTETLGFKLVHQEGNRFRYRSSGTGAGTIVDILCSPEEKHGRVAVGTVHHIAWRTADDAEQSEWLRDLTRLNYNVSPVMDRKYFHSIYFREPGGILFEIATDPPGFTVDEKLETLGEHLVLPPWLEPSRDQITRVLPPIQLPTQPASQTK